MSNTTSIKELTTARQKVLRIAMSIAALKMYKVSQATEKDKLLLIAYYRERIAFWKKRVILLEAVTGISAETEIKKIKVHNPITVTDAVN